MKIRAPNIHSIIVLPYWDLKTVIAYWNCYVLFQVKQLSSPKRHNTQDKLPNYGDILQGSTASIPCQCPASTTRGRRAISFRARDNYVLGMNITWSQHIAGLVKDCSNCSALAMEMLQSCSTPLMFYNKRVRLIMQITGVYKCGLNQWLCGICGRCVMPYTIAR